MATKRTSGVQIIKSGSGDIMLIVPIDKNTAAKFNNQKIAVAVAKEIDISKLPICGARYDYFRFRKDLIQSPVARIRK